MIEADVTTPGGPDAVRRAARSILARSEFRPTPKSPLERLRSWVLHELGRLVNNLLRATPTGLVGAVVVTAVVVVLVALTVRAVRGANANPVRTGFRVEGARRPPAEWLAAAVRHEQEGDWREALRCRYRALVAELGGRGVLDEIPGRTTGEYRRQVERALPSRSGPFAGATELFESAWYGDEPTDAATEERFRVLAGEVLERSP